MSFYLLPAGLIWTLSMTLIIITPMFLLFGTSLVDVIIVEILNIIICFGSQWVSRK